MPTAMRPGKRRAALAHELGVAQRRGAEHDAVDAEREPLLDGGERAHAAAELHRHALRRRRGSRAPRAVLPGAPARAPSRSTTWSAAQRVRREARRDRGRIRRRRPSPRRSGPATRRTQRPPSRSIAGISSKARPRRDPRRRAERQPRAISLRAPTRELVGREPARAAARVARRQQHVLGERAAACSSKTPLQSALALRRAVERRRRRPTLAGAASRAALALALPAARDVAEQQRHPRRTALVRQRASRARARPARAPPSARADVLGRDHVDAARRERLGEVARDEPGLAARGSARAPRALASTRAAPPRLPHGDAARGARSRALGCACGRDRLVRSTPGERRRAATSAASTTRRFSSRAHPRREGVEQRACPAAWLFSGWNCTAKTFSCATAAANVAAVVGRARRRRARLAAARGSACTK